MPDDANDIINTLARELNVSQVTARLLVRRQLQTVEQARRFLHVSLDDLHDPFLLQDMQKACGRIEQALRSDQKICIYGDYDVDGAVATALLVLFFRDLGKAVEFYIPSRAKEGYSLNPHAVHTLRARGVDLIITVDNGSMAHDAVALAQSLGIDVILTDHHRVADTLPPATAVINPQRSDCAYPFKGICGAGVAFKLVMALRSHLRDVGFFATRAVPHLKQYFDLLCLSTICDVVPLVDENRLFVKEGLKHLQFTTRPGLKALKMVCGLDRQISASDVGYRMGPRLNAAGRLDDASQGVRMLISDNLEEARTLALTLDRLNEERRGIEREIVDEAVKEVFALLSKTAETFPSPLEGEGGRRPGEGEATDYQDGPLSPASRTLPLEGGGEKKEPVKSSLSLADLPAGLVVFQPHWHIGVVGIVASRLVEKFARPVFVLCEPEPGVLKGSGRSFGSVNLVQALQGCAPHLQKFGGHEAAAGVTLAKDKLADFQNAFALASAAQTDPQLPAVERGADDVILAGDINEALLKEIELLEPFGMGNAAPLFQTDALPVTAKRIVGEKHLKLTLKTPRQSLDGIAFYQAESFHQIHDSVQLLFHLERNRYKNQDRLQLVIREILG